MNRSLFLTVLAGLALAFASTACDGEFSGLIPSETVPLSTSSDPGVKAAGDSTQAIDKVHKAEQLLQQGLTNKDPAKLSEAVRTRPGDPSLRFYQSAMLLAIGNITEARRAYTEGDWLVGRNYGLFDEDRFTELGPLWLDALSVTTTKFPKGSAEWQRVNRYYCNALQEFRVHKVLKLDSIYQDDTCK